MTEDLARLYREDGREANYKGYKPTPFIDGQAKFPMVQQDYKFAAVACNGLKITPWIYLCVGVFPIITRRNQQAQSSPGIIPT